VGAIGTEQYIQQKIHPTWVMESAEYFNIFSWCSGLPHPAAKQLLSTPLTWWNVEGTWRTRASKPVDQDEGYLIGEGEKKVMERQSVVIPQSSLILSYSLSNPGSWNSSHPYCTSSFYWWAHWCMVWHGTSLWNVQFSSPICAPSAFLLRDLGVGEARVGKRDSHDAV